MKTLLQRPSVAKPDTMLHEWKFVSLWTVSDQNGKPYEWAYRPGTWEVVNAYIENISRNTIVLIEQFRPIHQKINIERVAWLVDPWFTPEQAIVKEIKEETGYTVEKVQHLLSGPKSAWANNEFMHTYYASVHWDPGEQELEEWEKWLIVHEIKNDYESLEDFLLLQQTLWRYIAPSILTLFSHVEMLKNMWRIQTK